MFTQSWNVRVATIAGVALVVLAGCGRDLSLPQEPQRGRILGRLDTGGRTPPSGLTVEVIAEDTSRRQVVTEGEDGHFVVSDLAPGLYAVQVDAPGFAQLVTPSLRVRAGQDTDAGSLVPTWLGSTPREGLVAGKVVVGEGRATTTQGGQVEFLLGAARTRVAITPIGVDGEFVQRVPPGRYTLRAVHPLFVTKEQPNLDVAEAAQLDLSAQPLKMDINPARLVGQVLRERDGSTPVPAEGALVTLSNGETTVTDAAGNFVLSGLPAGSYTLRVTLQRHVDPLPTRGVTLRPGVQDALEAPVTLALARGKVAGEVVLGDGQTANDVAVTLTGTPYSTVAVPVPSAPSRAAFLLAGVPEGLYEVAVTRARYARATVPTVSVAGDATTQVGTLTLALLSGDFSIDDGRADNSPGYARTRGVTLNLSGLSGAAAFRASEDPAFAGVDFAPFTGNTQPFTLSDRQGTHVVYVQYRDGAGAVSPTLSASVVYDSVPPAAPALSLVDGRAFTRQANPLPATLDAQEVLAPGVDAVSGLAQVRLSATGALDAGGLLDAPAQPFQRNLSFTRPSSADGPVTVHAQFFDHAGNASAVVSDATVVDTVPPSGGVALQRGPRATADGYTDQPLVQVALTAGAEPNGGSVQVRLANAGADLARAVLQPPAGSVTWFLDPSTQGAKQVHAQLEDAAGNTFTVAPAGIVYDTTPPAGLTASVVGASLTRTRPVTVQVGGSDDRALSPTEALTLDEDPLFQGPARVGPVALPGSSQVGYTLSAGDGPKQLFVRFKDAAGNAATASVGLTLDTTAPTGSFVVEGARRDGTPSATVATGLAVTLVLDAAGATEYRAVDGALADCASGTYTALTGSRLPFTLNAGADGTRTVRLCLRDAAGNTHGSLADSIVLDTQAPACSAVAVAGRKVDGSAAPAGRAGSPFVDVTLSCPAGEGAVDVALVSGSVVCSPTATYPWTAITPALPFTLTGGDGLKTVSGCVRDAAGNVASLTGGTITLDTQPPTAPVLVLDSGAPYVNAAQIAARGGRIATAQGSATGATEWAVAASPSALTSFAPFASPASTPVDFGAADGLQTAYAVFRDDVGNATAVATDTIVFDNAAPAAGGLVIVTPSGNAFTSSVSVTLQLTAPADAAALRLGTAASAAACASTDLSAAPLDAVVGQRVFLLPSGDGLKGVCAQYLDAAGNPGARFGAQVTLDTVPPSVPLVTTQPQTLNLADNAAFVVSTAAGVSDANFARYERLGGKDGVWTADSASATTTSFTFRVVSLGGAANAAGVPNLLRLRAVDQAGNVSPEASVVVTTDIVAPQPVTLSTRWVNNASGQATVYWQPSSSPDVALHRVYYGAASGAGTDLYSGTYAQQGASPFQAAGTARSTTLSGLVNGAATFVRVRAVDFAGNVSGVPAGVNEVMLQPGRVSPNLMGTVALTGLGRPHHIVVEGDVAYVAGGAENNCGTAPALAVLDLARIESPIHGGTIRTSPALPTRVTTLTLPGALDCTGINEHGTDVVVHGNRGFFVGGTTLSVLDLSNPLAPTVLRSVDLGARGITQAHAVALSGDVLFVHGRPGVLVAYRVADLFDNNAATVFDGTGTDYLGAATNVGTYSGSLSVTRDWLVKTGGGQQQVYYRIADALDSDAATVFDNADLLGTSNIDHYWGAPAVSGNLLFMGGLFSLNVLSLNGQGITPAPPNLWANAVPGNGNVLAGLGGEFQALSLAGSQLMVGDSGAYGWRVLDLATLPDLGLVGGVSMSTWPAAMATYGNYQLVGTPSGVVEVYEVATPRSLNKTAQVEIGGQRLEVDGAFLYSGGSVVDLASGATPSVAETAGDCTADSVRFGSYLVQANGVEVMLVQTEAATDRNPATAYGPFIGGVRTPVAMPAGIQALAVEAWGPYLFFAERREGTGNDGVFVRVVNGNDLLDRRAATTLDWAGDTVGAFRVSATVGTSERFDLQMHRGLLLLSRQGDQAPGLHLLDLRAFLDDDAATAAPSSADQGFVPALTAPANYTGPRQAVGLGGWAYLATEVGLESVDISAALDGSAATRVQAPFTRGSLSVGGAEGVAAYGSYAYLVPLSTSEGITSVDITTPATPVAVSEVHFERGGVSCSAAGGNYYSQRAGITVRGSRAWASTYLNTAFLELE